MKPSAHIASVIELLTLFEEMRASGRKTPADAFIGAYFKQRRFIGAKDKAEIATLFYSILRHDITLGWLLENHQYPLTPRNRMLTFLSRMRQMDNPTITHLFNGERYAPASLSSQETTLLDLLASSQHQSLPPYVRYAVPSWIYDILHTVYGEETEALTSSLLQEAPTDIRVNRLKADKQRVLELLQQEGIGASPTPFTPDGIRLHKRTALFTLPAFQQGWFEVQDEGSQLLAMLVDAKPGERIIDFCAGAGGKTLAMAASMQNKGRILAWDVNERRLMELPKRLKRAGVHNVEWHTITSEQDSWIKRHKQTADAVLVDAPCTGTGTWRRNPDVKNHLTLQDVQELTALQASILQSASRMVKPGGRIIYATCSLLPEENEQQITHFLNHHAEFVLQPVTTPATGTVEMLRLSPHQHHTDGFFAAILMRKQ